MSATADQRAAFYKKLAVGLAVGVAIAVILGLGGVEGFGLFTPKSADLAAGLALFAIFVVLTWVLVRMVSVFDAVDELKEWSVQESRRAEADRNRLGQVVEDARLAVRQEMEKTSKQNEQRVWDAGEKVRRDVEAAQRAFAQELKAGWDKDVASLKSLFERGQKETDTRLARAESALERATQSATERAKMDLAAAQKRDVVVMQREAEVTNQIKQLQEESAGLRRDLKSIEKRVAEAMDALEHREMEAAADRQKMEHELAGVRKRGELLLIKNRELEQIATAPAKPEPIKLTEADLAQHVITIEGIGTKYAALLNAMGIISMRQLAAADPEAVADKIDVMPGLVEEWQSMARLITLRHVGPQFAEVLVRAGVKSIDQLAGSDAMDLARKIQKLEEDRKVKIQGAKVTEGTVNRWIQAARARDLA